MDLVGIGGLALKLVLTPVLIGLASLVGRRWGPGIGGWLVGLPFTSGPIAFFLASEHGPAFAASAATGTLAGTLSQAVFCLAYGGLAGRFGWPVATVGGSLAFAAGTLLWQQTALAPLPLLVGVVGGLALSLVVLPASARATARPPRSRWDLPARMVVATAIVLLLTGLAPALGPRLTGLLSPYPVYAAVLTVFAHRWQGPGAARGVLRGLLFGLFAFAAFFAVLALWLPTAGLAPAFLAAIAVALAIQGATLWLMRRLAPAAPHPDGHAAAATPLGELRRRAQR